MIRSLHLRDFKSFHEVKIPLGPFTLVVGANASGKSNLRDALRFVHGVGLGLSIAEIFGEKYGPGGILQWRGIRGGLPEAARVGASTFGTDVKLTVQRGVRRYSIDVEIHRGGSRAAVLREELETDGVDDHRWAVAATSDLRHPNRERPGLTQPSGFSDEDSEQSEVASAFASMRFLDLHPDAMRVASNPGQTTLGDRGENLSSVLQAICADPARETILLEWVRALTPLDATELTFEQDFTGRILVHLVEANGTKLSAASVSDGTLRFLAMVAALLSEDTGRIYVFEELDNGLHPTRLHLLLDLIERACASQGIQVIGTTHNPAMLAFLSERARDDALLVFRGEDHCSHVRRIMELPNISKILARQDLGQLLLSGWLDDAASFTEPADPTENPAESA